MPTVSLILHVLAAAVLVGGELLLLFAVTPATWLVDDERQRRALTRVVTRRFATMTVGALAVLLVTGVYQLLTSSLTPAMVRDDLFRYRFGSIFALKLVLVAALLALIGVHGAYFGPRIARASERVEREGGDEARIALENQRRTSLVFSLLMMLVSIAVLALGVALSNHNFSHVRLG